MGEDLSTGAKIGIILIILCSLIAIVFALLTMMKNITNTGSSGLQSSLDQMLLSRFDDYNQKIVTGTQVMSAMKIFEAEEVAIVIKPGLAEKGAAATQSKGGYNYGVCLEGYAEQDGPAGFGKIWTCAQDIDISDATAFADNTSYSGLYLHSSKTYYVGNLLVPQGQSSPERNYNTRPLGANGKQTYLNGSNKFRAMLIKDAADTIIGVVFNQIPT